MFKDLPASLISAVSRINQKSREVYTAEQQEIAAKKAASAKMHAFMPKQPTPKADPAAVTTAKKMAEESEGSIPKTPREKELAAKSGNKKRITFGDVLKARGVKKKYGHIKEGQGVAEGNNNWGGPLYDPDLQKGKKKPKLSNVKVKFPPKQQAKKDAAKLPKQDVKTEDVELDEANTETKKEFQARQERLAAAHAETQKDPKRLARLMKIPGYADAMALAKKTTQKEEVENIDEREMTSGEKSEKERLVKSMKKGFKGFRERYGNRAKNVMYATATKRAMGEDVETDICPECLQDPCVCGGNHTSVKEDIGAMQSVVGENKGKKAIRVDTLKGITTSNDPEVKNANAHFSGKSATLKSEGFRFQCC